MKPIRFNLNGLMTVVAVAAVGLDAWRRARPGSLDLPLLLALGLDLGAILAAFVAESRTRVFAIGYLLLGCGYFVLIAAPPCLDAILHDHLFGIHPLADPRALPDPRTTRLPIDAHSLIDMAAGMVGGFAALVLARPGEGDLAAPSARRPEGSPR